MAETVKLTPASGDVAFWETVAKIDGLDVLSLHRLFLADALRLYHVQARGKRIGVLVVGRENDAWGGWLIVHALQCDVVRGLDITALVLVQLVAVIEATGLVGLRCWTEREGLRRKMEKSGAKTRYVLELRP